MKIMCKQDYYDQVVQYAESIKDTSLQNCMERLEAWEKNPDRPCEIELYHDWACLLYFLRRRRVPVRDGCRLQALA